MKCITLSGEDGSGKTTIASLLLATLKRKKPTGFYWMRGSHTIASIILRFFAKIRSMRGACNPYYWVCIPRKLGGLWVHIEFWSLVPHLVVRAIIARANNYTICDRGPLDAAAWMVVTLGNPGFVKTIYGRFLLLLAGREHTIYVHASPQELRRRSDLPYSFVEKQIPVYRVLSKYIAKQTINTTSKTPLTSLKEALYSIGLLSISRRNRHRQTTKRRKGLESIEQ